jgi:hypothetical protein
MLLITDNVVIFCSSSNISLNSPTNGAAMNSLNHHMKAKKVFRKAPNQLKLRIGITVTQESSRANHFSCKLSLGETFYGDANFTRFGRIY